MFGSVVIDAMRLELRQSQSCHWANTNGIDLEMRPFEALDIGLMRFCFILQCENA